MFSTSLARLGADTKAKRRARTRLLLFAVVGISAVLMSASYSVLIAMSLAPMGQLYLLPAMMTLAVSLLTFMSAMARARTALFSASDFDMLMSLPLSRGTVVAARLVSFYAFELLLALAVLIPCGVVYAIYAAPAWTFYVLFVLCLPLVPLIPAAVGGALGTLVAAIFARSRLRNLFNTVMLMALVIGLFALSMTAPLWMNDLGGAASSLMGGVGVIYPVALWFAEGVAGINPLALLYFVLLSLAAAAVFGFFANLSFKRLASLLTSSYRAGSYQLRELQAGSQLWAMYKKEWRRYTASSLYVMNTMFGNIILLLGAVFLAFWGRDMVLGAAEQFGLTASLGPALALLMGWFSGLGVTTTASISLEGKTLWIAKQLPVPARTWLLSKMLVSFTVSMPATVLSAGLLAFGLGLSAVDTLLVLLVPLCSIYAFSVFGLWLNIKNPKFDWKHETEVVKQGTPILIIALGSMLVFGLLAAAIFLLPAGAVLFGWSLLSLVLALLTWMYLTRNGERLRLGL